MCQEFVPPKKNPTRKHKEIPISSLTTPVFINFVSLMTAPKHLAIIGPIRGEMSILATRFTELSSSKPKAAMIAATMIKIIKSNVTTALLCTDWTTWATVSRDLIDATNLVPKVVRFGLKQVEEGLKYLTF